MTNQTDFPFQGQSAAYWLGWFRANIRTSPSMDDVQSQIAYGMCDQLDSLLAIATTCDTTPTQHAMAAAIAALMTGIGEIEV